ncbi:hypothetical protein CR513_03394, partial [Mucuna pruriens]
MEEEIKAIKKSDTLELSKFSKGCYLVQAISGATYLQMGLVAEAKTFLFTVQPSLIVYSVRGLINPNLIKVRKLIDRLKSTNFVLEFILGIARVCPCENRPKLVLHYKNKGKSSDLIVCRQHYQLKWVGKSSNLASNQLS